MSNTEYTFSPCPVCGGGNDRPCECVSQSVLRDGECQRCSTTEGAPVRDEASPDTQGNQMSDMKYTRETAHATFNGGHHDGPRHMAFHHGMDTVFNLIEADAVVGLHDMKPVSILCEQGDDGVPLPIKQELMGVAQSKSMSYYYLCAIYRQGLTDKEMAMSEPTEDEMRQEQDRIDAASERPDDIRPTLLEAFDKAQCACSIAERESGHLVDCWYPDLEEAINALKTISCPHCEGIGHVHGDGEFIECPACEGTGRTPAHDHEKCGKCDGEGKITATEAAQWKP